MKNLFSGEPIQVEQIAGAIELLRDAPNVFEPRYACVAPLAWNFGHDLHAPRGGRWSARLMDESDPCSAVVISNDDGSNEGTIYMPQEVFRSLRQGRWWGTGTPMKYKGPDLVHLPPTLTRLKAVQDG